MIRTLVLAALLASPTLALADDDPLATALGGAIAELAAGIEQRAALSWPDHVLRIDDRPALVIAELTVAAQDAGPDVARQLNEGVRGRLESLAAIHVMSPEELAAEADGEGTPLLLTGRLVDAAGGDGWAVWLELVDPGRERLLVQAHGGGGRNNTAQDASRALIDKISQLNARGWPAHIVLSADEPKPVARLATIKDRTVDGLDVDEFGRWLKRALLHSGIVHVQVLLDEFGAAAYDFGQGEPSTPALLISGTVEEEGQATTCTLRLIDCARERILTTARLKIRRGQ